MAAEPYSREENLFPVHKPTKSKVIDQKLKLAHKLVDVMNRTNKKIYVTLRQFNVDELESSSLQFLLFVKKAEKQKLQ